MVITLKAARVNKNFTQDYVAKKLNVTKKTIGSWESGKTSPDTKYVGMLCELYGASYIDINWNA